MSLLTVLDAFHPSANLMSGSWVQQQAPRYPTSVWLPVVKGSPVTWDQPAVKRAVGEKSWEASPWRPPLLRGGAGVKLRP